MRDTVKLKYCLVTCLRSFTEECSAVYEVFRRFPRYYEKRKIT